MRGNLGVLELNVVSRLKPLGRIALFVMVVVAPSCADPHRADDQRILRLGSSLTKLSRAVEYTVRYGQPVSALSDEALLAQATEQDPTLLMPFKGYVVRVSRQDRHAVVLVCTSDPPQALLEDAGCTARLDKESWRQAPGAACEFSLQAAAVCAPR